MGFISKMVRKLFYKKLESLKNRQCDLKTVKLHRELFASLYKMRLVENAVNVGQKLPIKEVTTCFGEQVNVQELLKKGPVVVKFYRGTWCTYCETDLAFLHESFPALEAEGASVIAISTEPTDFMAENSKKNDYRFYSVPDNDRSLSKSFGLLFKVPEGIVQAYEKEYNVDTKRFMETRELSLPATYVVDRFGDVVYASMNEDFRSRASVDEVIHYVKKAKLDKKKYFSLCHEEECKIKSFISGIKKKADDRKEERRISRGSLKDEKGSIHSLTLSEFSKDPLGYCLQNPEFLDSFKDYLTKTYCMENLLFYLETRDFEANWAERSEEERKAEAQRIYDTFVRPGSELEVNLDETTRELIAQNLKGEAIPADFYEKSGRETYTLMETDSFSKWKRTRDYATIWKREGSLDFLSPFPTSAEAA